MSEWGNKDLANNKPHFLDVGAANTYFSNSEVYLVNSSRLANASFGNDKAVSHQGWVKIKQGTGFVQQLVVSNVNPSLVYSNAWILFYGSNTSAANAKIVVTGGNNVSVVLNTGGNGYKDIPTANVSGTNNSTLIFTVTPGGRMGRVEAETLVAMSSPLVSDANSGLPYFTGV